MQQMPDAAEPDLRSYLDVLWRRKWIVIAVVVATSAVALALSVTQTPLYRATAEVLVESGTPQQIFDPVTGAYNDPARSIQNEIEFMTSDEVADAVDEELPDAAPVSITARDDADIISVSATSEDAQLAADTANTYAEVYLRERRQQSVRDYQESAAVVEAQLQELTTQIAQVTTTLEQVALELVAPTPETPVEELALRQTRLQQRLATLEQERTELQATARQLELTGELLREGQPPSLRPPPCPAHPSAPNRPATWYWPWWWASSSASAWPSCASTSTTRCAPKKTSRPPRACRCSPCCPAWAPGRTPTKPTSSPSRPPERRPPRPTGHYAPPSSSPASTATCRS